MKLVNLFSAQNMLKQEQVMGDIPTSRIIYRNFLKIAWPSALEALLVALIGIVDTMMVSNLGLGAIAAVGITNQPKFVLLAMIFSLNTGITAVIARRKGQEDQLGANKTLRVGILLCTISSFLMAILGYLFATPILLLAGADQSYLPNALVYFKVLMISIPFQALNLTINAAQRGCGKARISMWTNVISNLINIIFNFLLINGIGFFPRMGIKGSATATTLGAFAAFSISLFTLLRKNAYLTLHMKAGWKLTKSLLNPITKVSGSAFVEQVFLRIGFLAYAGIVARLGTIEYTTHLICMNILTLSFCFGDGLSIAASALVGQNMGAKRPDLSIIYGKTGQRLAFIISTFVFFVFIFGRNLLVSPFSNEPEVLLLGAHIMILAALGTHMQTSQVVMNGCLRGAGDTNFVAITSLVSVALVRPFLTWFLCFPAGFGLYGAWIALIVDQSVRMVLSYLRFSSAKWATISL